MRRDHCRFDAVYSVISLVLVLFCNTLLGASSGQCDSYTLDGRTLSGSLIEVSGDGSLRIQAGSGVKSVAFDRVHMISFPAAETEPLGEGAVGILFQGGDYLTGVLTGGDEERIVLDNPLLGILDIPIDSLRMLLPGRRDIPADFGRYAPSVEEDVVYRKRASGFGEDFIDGTVDLISDEGLTFECSLGLVEFAFDELNAVVIGTAGAGRASAEAEAEEKTDTFVILRGGAGRLTGSVKALTGGKLELEGSVLGEISLRLEMIDSIAFRRDGMVFLSDLEPSSKEQTPYLGAAEDFLFPFQIDRSVSGRALVCDGRRFARGLGIHSKTVLTWDLGGAYSSFNAFVGISDETLELKARGSMRFRVLVDGRQVYESPVLRGGDGVVHLPRVPLEGAGTLTLEADFADGFDSGDRGLWGQAFVIR